MKIYTKRRSGCDNYINDNYCSFKVIVHGVYSWNWNKWKISQKKSFKGRLSLYSEKEDGKGAIVVVVDDGDGAGGDDDAGREREGGWGGREGGGHEKEKKEKGLNCH